MKRELIICIPGPWRDRSDFIGRVITAEPKGRFMFAGMILADVEQKDHVSLEFCDSFPKMEEAFRIAGQGKLPDECLEQIRLHTSVVYLHFPINLQEQCERVAKFTLIVRQAGGIAVKVESAGVAHTWETWETRLRGSLFDLYCCAIVLVGDKQSFYSCGMHHFGLPECEVPSYIGAASGADLINRFNSWQIGDRPAINSGETFSLAADELPFRLDLQTDARHSADNLFHNPHGVWVLRRATNAEPAPNQWTKPEGEPLFVAVAEQDEQMLLAYSRARQTLPQFLNAIRSSRFSGATNSVKIKLRDDESSEDLNEDRFAYLWLWDVRQTTDSALQATVRELPNEGFGRLKVSETLHFEPHDVHDWMILEGSQAWGGFTLRVIRDRMGLQERLQYDEYTGILCYNELDRASPPMP
jgi:uncharacterized protein YegJ (DUF2314 family)